MCSGLVGTVLVPWGMSGEKKLIALALSRLGWDRRVKGPRGVVCAVVLIVSQDG
jgi:hypothetical protein